MRQHLTCVNAAAEVCGADVDGAEIGSTELSFKPGRIKGGEYQFAIGSGGSTTLVLQTVLPALMYAPTSSEVRIEGGTHNPLAPPFEFVEQCYLPILRGMGCDVVVELLKHGFMKSGGGVLMAHIKPLAKWKSIRMLERGELLETFGVVIHAHLDRSIVNREIASAAGILEWEPEKIEVRYANDCQGSGNAILLGARFENVCEISTGVAQIGKSAESVGTGAAKGLRGYLASRAPVGVLLADQLLIPMALAVESAICTVSISDHTKTNISLIEQFLDVRFEIEDEDRRMRMIRCESKHSA